MIRKLDYNAPVALTFALLSLIALFLGWVTGGVTTTKLFCVYGSSWADALTYVRLFGHVLGHADLSHYISNMMLFLLLGPIVEEEYSSGKLLLMIAATSVVTGLVGILLFPRVGLLGASGVVFMMIILASMVSYRKGRIPITFIAVALLYLGQEIHDAVFITDNISQLSHIVGGVLGLLFGMAFRKGRR